MSPQAAAPTGAIPEVCGDAARYFDPASPESIAEAVADVLDHPEELVRRTSRILEETLGHFGIEATVADTVSGPRVTRYELQLAPGTKVSKVAALKDDLSYALATTEIRILAPIPGKQAVGVEVPNLSPRLVTLGDIFDDVPGAASPAAPSRTIPASARGRGSETS